MKSKGVPLQIKSKSVFLQRPGSLELADHIFSYSPKQGALLKLIVTTICGSDIRISKFGDSRINEPRILGHEMVARVLDPGTLTRFQPGDLVAVGADIPCGECNFCKVGKSNLCEVHVAFGYQIDGGFSEYMVVPSKHLNLAPIVRVEHTDYLKTFALAEPTGCAINGLRFSDVGITDNILIFGGGPVGILLALLANLRIGIPQSRILIIEPSAERRAIIETLGITSIGSENEIHRNEEFVFGASKVFTATSAAITHQSAIKHVSPGGAINFFGGVPKDSPMLMIHANELHYKEISLGGSHGSRPEDHAQAVEIIQSNLETWSKLLSRTYPVEEFRNAFDHVQSATVLKIGIHFNE